MSKGGAAAGQGFPRTAPLQESANLMAPLCKGGCRRNRLGDCAFPERPVQKTIPPARYAGHLPLHKGGFWRQPVGRDRLTASWIWAQTASK